MIDLCIYPVMEGVICNHEESSHILIPAIGWMCRDCPGGFNSSFDHGFTLVMEDEDEDPVVFVAPDSWYLDAVFQLRDAWEASGGAEEEFTVLLERIRKHHHHMMWDNMVEDIRQELINACDSGKLSLWDMDNVLDELKK